uniref:Uncharacterized protein LOC114341466 n=1 Tax=Diabrotica virgifera virgifera TaxID=50390 RepID=A0A6P7GW66_DIAVI
MAFRKFCQRCSQRADWLKTDQRLRTNDLLKLLKNDHPDLPSDSRTLLKTPREVAVADISPGQYYHFGLSFTLNNLLHALGEKECSKLCCLELMINVDGLLIAKSSSKQLYPILCQLYKQPLIEVIGLYHGLQKSKDPNELLTQFIDEVIYFTNNGYFHNDKHYNFKIIAFICDAPAKSFISFTKGHTGYRSCSKCYTEGTYFNTVCFPEFEGLNMRTDLEFRQKVDEQPYRTLT